MKSPLLLSLLLVGCVSNPSVTTIAPDGTITRYSTGVNLMAEVDEQVSEVQGPGGIHIRHMVKRQDATRVPIAGFQALGVYGAGKLAAASKDLKTTTDGNVALGAQKAEVSKAQIAADEAVAKGAQANEALKITTQP